MKTTRFTITFIAIISFFCIQQSAKKIDLNNTGKEVHLSLLYAFSLLVPEGIKATQNKEIADRPACCKKVPTRFKLNASGLKKF